MTIPIQDQVRCAQRELAMRLKVYPNSVQLRRMSQEQCDREIAAMSAIVATLQKVQMLWEVSEEIKAEPKLKQAKLV